MWLLMAVAGLGGAAAVGARARPSLGGLLLEARVVPRKGIMVTVLDLDTGRTRRLHPSNCRSETEPGWQSLSPNGCTLLHCAGDELVLFDVRSGRRRVVGSGGGHHRSVQGVELSLDGRWVVYRQEYFDAGESTTSTLVVDVASGPELFLEGSFAGWHPQGAVVKKGTQVSLLEPVTERTRPLLSTGSYSPDGSMAADWDGRQVWIKQGGHEPVKVPGFDTVPDELHWSAEGRTLVVVSTEACRAVWAVDVASREGRRLWPRR